MQTSHWVPRFPLLYDTAKGLAYLHNHKTNFLLSLDGVANKTSDFGNFRIIDIDPKWESQSL